ncbi:hypothetical protein [Kitasatospora fiedleri]|uniref:hypothetical protein n=1 Tax=Kitasatospora fiedleri TaxID=2991545 RepID=UPI002499CCD8|nr:hypothetical protein [Kitasatospora fiedleri]
MATRIRFTGWLTYSGETGLSPDSAVETALDRGDRHSAYSLSLDEVLTVDEVPDEE